MKTEHASAKLLLQETHLPGGGWLMAPDAEEMSQKLGLLFGDQYSGFSNLLIPHFLNERIRPNGVLLQHTDDDGDPLEEAGFLLSDDDGVPLLKRLRGIRLDVLKALAQWCSADDLVRMIDGEPPEQISPQPAPALMPTEDRDVKWWHEFEAEKLKSKGKLSQAEFCRRVVASGEARTVDAVKKALQRGKKEQAERSRNGGCAPKPGVNTANDPFNRTKQKKR